MFVCNCDTNELPNWVPLEESGRNVKAKIIAYFYQRGIAAENCGTSLLNVPLIPKVETDIYYDIF